MKYRKYRNKPKVFPFDNRQREAMELVRSLALDNTDKIFFGQHAEDQMDLRGITKLSALRALAVGDPKGEWAPGRNDQETKLEVTYRAKGSREIVVVTVVVTLEAKAFVRTVFWSDK